MKIVKTVAKHAIVWAYSIGSLCSLWVSGLAISFGAYAAAICFFFAGVAGIFFAILIWKYWSKWFSFKDLV